MTEWLQAVLRRPPIGWWDILDVAIVAVFFYQLLLLIRGTRAVQMAVGGGLVTALFFLSRWLELEAVNWLIRNAAAYVVFAVIVLFQADIRRALAHFGRAPFLRYFSRVSGAEEAVEELVVAVGNLSSHKIGALIVIERQIGLRNYIEGGIPLDATITYDLLASIFQITSPLHDGAVIVQGNRIAAAACFLPLSVNPKVSRTLGTRHRAALGLTEENDAVAVVVSEETGVISLAINGRLERDFTPDMLRLRLGALLGVVRRDRATRRTVDARSTAA
jgi:diadenylate cyclase